MRMPWSYWMSFRRVHGRLSNFVELHVIRPSLNNTSSAVFAPFHHDADIIHNFSGKNRSVATPPQ